MSPHRRWPLHPRPGPFESLSSWLERTARLYRMPVSGLLEVGLGPGAAVPAALDRDPPAAMLAALAGRTGAGLAELRAMTLAGWVPWLMDSLYVRPQDAQEVFDTYVRENSVLFAPGVAGRNYAPGPGGKTWRGPWLPARPLDRGCPACTAGPDRRRALMWQLPLVAGCAEHGCRLAGAAEVTVAELAGDELRPVPLEEPDARLDRYTWEGIATGRVTLPGRQVHAGVWFRLLRSLLDEVSLNPATRSAHPRTTLEQVWQATGRPARGGLNVWRPYEHMDWPLQESMLSAAATAVQMAADGRIAARGTLGPLLAREPYRPARDGDPSAYNWKREQAAASAVIDRARADPDTARRILAMFTVSCRTLASFNRERDYFIRIGIPADFLPSAQELGRADLA